MKISLLTLMALAALFFGGCASGLEVEDTSDRGPAPHSPDPTEHLAPVLRTDALGGPKGG